MFAPVTSSADSGCRRRQQHLDAGRVRREHRLDDVLSVVSNEPTRSAIVLAFGLMFRITAMSPKRRLPSTSTTGLLVRLVQRDCQVRRDRGAADAALGREERDDLAALGLWRREDVGVPHRPVAAALLLLLLLLLLLRRVALAAHLLELVDVADRVDQLVGGEGLHQELARPGEHRAAQVVLLALDGHHDDRGLGDRVRR